ncbi:hypothetical protein [Natrinema versiforme]|uniref:Uncharacterized protein n=1 Tax=Natrinema versiforme TaxID=88724 RepID=A0A4P8WRJ2_9EURY|nr:hypothetical protein [Natrinema versiforme]QCS44741.1 hypothetical protein FEJ81_20925 [Natrinema versiforme]
MCDSVMSKTVRVSDDLYGALDEYREKNQTFQDVIEALATEAGLLPRQINDADDLEKKLRMQYGYAASEVQQVMDALRYVYTGQEQEQSIGVPHAAADERYGDEIDALKRLNLVKEKHYTGKYDYGYRTTKLGEKIGSELMRTLLDDRANEIQDVFDRFDDTLLSVLINFGFEKTDSGHLSDRGAALNRSYGPELWDIDELGGQYTELKQTLGEVGVAARYHVDTGRTVLPPEFSEFLSQHADTELSSVLRKIEVFQVLLNYTREELETRDDIVKQLDTASERDFEEMVESFYDQGLTSRYISDKETPLLIKDSDGVRERIEREMKQELDLN